MELNYSGSGDVFYNKKTYKCDLYINSCLLYTSPSPRDRG